MAKKYSLAVKVLKRMLVVSAAILLFSIMILPSFLKSNDRVKLNSVSNEVLDTLSSNEMVNPNLHGQDKNGRPYILTAKSGYKTNDNIIKLSDITGKLRIEGEHKYYALSSKNGEYKQNSDLIHLCGDIVIINQGGYTATTQEAVINYKKGSAYTITPIHIEGKDLRLEAGNFEMPSANVLIFKNNVKVLIK
ncbi:LPS export ABC transporter periplasmic protein LptC [Holosporaceae bacterium 'Namur']|nr:LPS export ABC transporter periplasmic protein LptC [Holosporaceae bacterium 'Namur']